jgi:hypothetical protein
MGSRAKIDMPHRSVPTGPATERARVAGHRVKEAWGPNPITGGSAEPERVQKPHSAYRAECRSDDPVFQTCALHSQHVGQCRSTRGFINAKFALVL